MSCIEDRKRHDQGFRRVPIAGPVCVCVYELWLVLPTACADISLERHDLLHLLQGSESSDQRP